MQSDNKSEEFFGNKFKDYQDKIMDMRLHDEGEEFDNIISGALGLTGEAGEFADIIKKIKRGDYTLEEKREELLKELGDVMWYVTQVANDMGTDIGTIADINVKKIESRIVRGVWRGDGNNR